MAAFLGERVFKIGMLGTSSLGLMRRLRVAGDLLGEAIKLLRLVSFVDMYGKDRRGDNGDRCPPEDSKANPGTLATPIGDGCDLICDDLMTGKNLCFFGFADTLEALYSPR